MSKFTLGVVLIVFSIIAAWKSLGMHAVYERYDYALVKVCPKSTGEESEASAVEPSSCP